MQQIVFNILQVSFKIYDKNVREEISFFSLVKLF